MGTPGLTIATFINSLPRSTDITANPSVHKISQLLIKNKFNLNSKSNTNRMFIWSNVCYTCFYWKYGANKEIIRKYSSSRHVPVWCKTIPNSRKLKLSSILGPLFLVISPQPAKLAIFVFVYSLYRSKLSNTWVPTKEIDFGAQHG